MDRIYPRTKFADENDIITQVKHIAFTLVDIIARLHPELDPWAFWEKMIQKNQERGYYSKEDEGRNKKLIIWSPSVYLASGYSATSLVVPVWPSKLAGIGLHYNP